MSALQVLDDKERAARFAREAEKGAPPIPKRRMAHPGGKMRTNKEEATKKFLERRQREGASTATKLYVGNVTPSFTNEDLAALFPGCAWAKVIKGRGFGFVEFEDPAKASAARKLNGSRIDGTKRRLTVTPAEDRKVLSSWRGPTDDRDFDRNAHDDRKNDRNDAVSETVDDTALNREKPLESPVVEAVTLWAVATPAEVEEWRSKNELGATTFADANRVKALARDDALLLCVHVDDLPQNVTWVDAAEPGDVVFKRDGGDVVRVDDETGVLELVTTTPWPFSLVRVFELTRGDDGVLVFPAECTLLQGPRPQTLAPGITVKY